MIPPLRVLPALVATVFVALLSSCASDPTAGYAAITPYPQRFETVAIHIFENQTFDREIEFELADALVKEVEARTPYKVTSDRTSDTIITGRITKVERDRLSKSRVSGLSGEVILSVTIDFEWRDARTGEIIVSRQEFTTGSLFLPSRPHGEGIELAEFAVAQQIARDIVAEMRSEW